MSELATINMKKAALSIFLTGIIILTCGATSVSAFNNGPVNPYSFSAEAGNQTGTVKLTWYDDGNEDQFNLLYGTGSSNFQFGQVALPVTHNGANTFTVSYLMPGQTYYFLLIGIHGNSSSASGPVTAVAFDPNSPPVSVSQSLVNSLNTQATIPYDFRVGQSFSSGTVTLIWTDNGTANRYDIVYGTTPGEYIYGVQNVPFTPNNASAYSIGYLKPYTTYYFELVAEKNGNVVAWTNPIAALTK